MYGHLRKGTVVGIAALVIVASTLPMRGADYTGSLQGVVKDASGTPVSGAFVKMKNDEKRLTFMVVTQAQGRYAANHLPPGKYVVQGIGNGFQSKLSVAVGVADGQAAGVDLSLTDPQAAYVPGRDSGGARGGQRAAVAGGGGVSPGPPPLPDGAGKAIVETKCATCHNLSTATNRAYDREQWENVLDEMRLYIQGAPNSKDLTDKEANTLLDYLVTNFSNSVGDSGGGPARDMADPNSHLPRTSVAGPAAKYVSVEFKIPTPNVSPHEITVDSDGNGWITERSGPGNLGRLDPHTLTYTEVAPPPGPAKSRLNGIWNGPNNKLWFVDMSPNRRILAYDTKGREFNSYVMPPVKSGTAAGNTIRVRQDGTVWYNAITNNEVMRLDPSTGKYTIFEVPTRNAWPYGLVVGGDGKIYLALHNASKIGRVDPDTGHIDEFDIPIPNSIPKKGEVDAKGNPWFALQGGNALLKIDPDTMKMTTYTPPTKNTGIYAATIDRKNGYVWYCTQYTQQIGRFDPKTKTWLEFYVPNADSDIRRCQVDQNNPNRVWWSGNNTDRMGFVELLDGN